MTQALRANCIRVLVVEDNRDICENIGDYLGARGHITDFAHDGISAMHLALTGPIDVIVLDLMLPGMDGLTFCRKLRLEAKRDTPVLMLTARDTLPDKLAGFDAGADDYLVKPFVLQELVARVKALLRRRGSTATFSSETISVGPLEVDIPGRRARVNGTDVDLTKREFDLLAVLAEHKTAVLSRAQLLELVWGYDFAADTNVVDVFIGYLRRKLEAGGAPRLLHTVRGVGFVLRTQ
jgi:two-component system response regulator PrrA